MTEPMFTEEFVLHPERVIAKLRQDDPVHWVEGMGMGYWQVTRYDDVRRLFSDEHVTPDRRYMEGYVPPPEGSFRRWLSENGFFSAPPEQHARLRKLISASMTPRSVARQENQVREVIEGFAAKLRGRTGVVDLHGEFTDPIPNAVIGRITGIPPIEDDEQRFRQIAQDALRGINPFADAESLAISEKAFTDLADWVREIAEARRRDPQEDLISDLVQTHDMDDRLTNDEIVSTIAGIVSAGSETTAMAGTLGLHSLFKHPDQLALLREDRSLLPNAVNEILRYDFGSGGLPRYVKEDFELRGKQIHKGQVMMLSFMGAHRDPEVFPDPDRFDVRRDTTKLTIFGHGPHFCLGANLAKAELRWILESALDVVPEDAKLLEDRIEYEQIAFFQRIVGLPVDFGSTSA